MVQPDYIFASKENSVDTEKEYAKKGRNRLAIKAKARDMSVSVFGLEKVPLEPLFKMALEEIGEQESCIEELEDKIKKMEKVNAEILKAETARWPSSWTTLTSRRRKRKNKPPLPYASPRRL